MSAETIAYVATSLDGYLAGEGGSVSFLEEFGSEEYDFHGFVDGIDAVVMGAATYEQILGWGWPYGDTPGLVLTSRDLAVPDGVSITFSAEPTGAAIRSYADGFDRRVWIVGGGVVITDAINDGAVDVLEMYVMPTVLGAGVPLFTQPVERTFLLRETTAFSNGAVRLIYSV